MPGTVTLSQRIKLKRQRPGVVRVDDFERFGIAISSLLRNSPRLRIIAEASEGVEAVDKAGLLQPVGLPDLDGIEAAREIREAAPESKTIFLTEEGSPLTEEGCPEIVEEAMQSGAVGYVHCPFVCVN